MKKTLSLLLCLCLAFAALPLTAAAAEMPFTDVPADAWYAGDVLNAHENGLIDGKGGGIFAPNDPLTCAEAAKLAACMYQKATEGGITLENGDPWYQPYVDYMDGLFYPFEYEWTKPATRAEFMEIFAFALPAEELEAVNDIPFGAIPDVPADHPQAGSIYRLYRAGIVQGSDGEIDGAPAENLCKPDDNIRRSEVAAILTRMTDADSRVSFSLDAPADAGTAAWSFEGAGTLVIRGDAEGDPAYPWAALKRSALAIRVEEGVTALGDGAFSGFRFVKSVELPDGLKSIGSMAFANCQSLEGIELPDGVESIGADAFSHCYDLASVRLPDSVTVIGDHAFSKCYALEAVVLPQNLETLEADLFFDCSTLTSVTLPAALTTIGERALCRTGIIEIEIPVSVTVIGKGAFEDCGDLQTVYYAGTDVQWNAIGIGEDNEALTGAVRKAPQTASAPAAA